MWYSSGAPCQGNSCAVEIDQVPVVIVANNGDRILTSDPDDLYILFSASGRRLDVVTV